MKIFCTLIILIFVQNCSFDNKTGIWKNENSFSKEDNEIFKEFKTLSSSAETYDKIVKLDKNFIFKLGNSINNFEWSDIYYKNTNNFDNFKYNNQNQLIFKSSKLTKHKVNDYTLFIKDYLITSDNKGNILIFSIKNNKLITKFNFYKKKYKKINKYLNIIVEKNVIYVADNIDYLYAFDFIQNKILWAKNYKVPFRSNLKISGNKLITSNQNNNLYFFTKNSGDILKLIPTEENVVKNQFKNNLSINKDSLFFINTFGSLYSVDIKKMIIKWFVNLNQSLDLNPSNLFYGNEIVNYEDKVVISSTQFTYIINTQTGSIIDKKNFSFLLKPVILNGYLFSVTKNNLLISMNLNNGNILYSIDVNQEIAEYLNTKKKKVEFRNIIVTNESVLIFLKNSYLLKFNINGDLEEVNKLPSKISTQPMIIDGSMLFLYFKNKLLILD